MIEASPRKVEVRKTNHCANHFEIQTHENRHHLVDSQKRIQTITEYTDATTDVKQAYHLFNDCDKGIFAKEYKSWAGTIHTSVYFPNEKKAWFTLGGDREPEAFDFHHWLQGNNVNMEKVYGEVYTELGFAHMDKNVR